MLISAHLKNFDVQYLNNQASDHPGSYVFFANLFTPFQDIVSVFQNCVTSYMTKLNHTNKAPVNLYIDDFK